MAVVIASVTAVVVWSLTPVVPVASAVAVVAHLVELPLESPQQCPVGRVATGSLRDALVP